MILTEKTITGIDPGRSNGAIATWHNGKLSVCRMPVAIADIAAELQQRGGYTLVEEIYLFKTDGATPGKQFGIKKLLENYHSILNALQILNAPYGTVHPSTWQREFRGLGKETKTMRNQRLVQLAKKFYPCGQVRAWNAHAVLIMHFARIAKTGNPRFLWEHSSPNTQQMKIWKRNSTLE